MARKRMFDKELTDTDKFLEMPLSTQALYFHLNMRADDEGFISNPKRIMRMTGNSEDDLKILIAKDFIITFDTGIIVIRHWKLNNYLNQSRIKNTIHLLEKSQILEDENGIYEKCLTDVKQMLNEYSIEESRIVECSVEENNIEENSLSTKVDDDLQNFIKNAIDYLNQKTNKRYTYNTKDTVKFLKALFKSKTDIEDVKKVIDFKVREWTNTDYEKYLRPATLFGNKFGTYLEDADNGNVGNMIVPDWLNKDNNIEHTKEFLTDEQIKEYNKHDDVFDVFNTFEKEK